MTRLKVTLYILLVLLVFDLLVLLGTAMPALVGWDILGSLIGSAFPDFYLRPMILITLGILALFLQPAVTGKYRKFVAAALFVAALVETVQNMQFNESLKIPFMALTTGGYYLLYILAFYSLVEKWTARSAIPFAVVIFYGCLMFLSLGIHKESSFLIPSIFYIVVTTIMIGVAFQRPIHGNLSYSSLFAAAGTVILLVSDSFRAISVFKFKSQGGFPLDEFLIMVLFYTGQFSIAWSVKDES